MIILPRTYATVPINPSGIPFVNLRNSLYMPDFFTFYDDIYCFIILPVFIFNEYVGTNELHGHKLIKIIFYKNIFY